MAGIVSFGAYIPYYRLPRSVIGQIWGQPGGRGEKAVAGSDEDPVTMSVASGLDCLKGIETKTINALFMATTCSPYRERQCSNIVANALDIPRASRNADFTNCLRAGTSAMLCALDAVKAGSLNRVLVTAADMRLGGAAGGDELGFGDGSAALLFGNDKVAVEVEGSHTFSDDLCDFWRDSDDKFVRHWEDRFGREEGYLKIPAEAVEVLLKKSNTAKGDIAKVCLYGANARVQATLGKQMGFKPEQIQDPLLGTVGDTGAALPLMILVAALEEAKPGDRILLVSYGNGSDAILLRVTEEIKNIKNRRGIKQHLNIKKTLNSYGRYLRWREMVSLAPAARPRPVRPPCRPNGGNTKRPYRSMGSSATNAGLRNCISARVPPGPISVSNARPGMILNPIDLPTSRERSEVSVMIFWPVESILRQRPRSLTLTEGDGVNF